MRAFLKLIVIALAIVVAELAVKPVSMNATAKGITEAQASIDSCRVLPVELSTLNAIAVANTSGGQGQFDTAKLAVCGGTEWALVDVAGQDRPEVFSNTQGSWSDLGPMRGEACSPLPVGLVFEWRLACY